VYEVEVTNSTITKKTYYYPAGAALRVEDLVAGTNTVYYVLKDHLGSASVTLDAGGNIVAEMRYYPFGEVRLSTGATPTGRLFQSQRDVGLGLMHFGARFYHPRLGRFISADTIVPNFADPQNLNRYAFVLNNPLKYTDPSGHMAMCGVECEAAGGAYGVSSTGQALTYKPATQAQIAAVNTTGAVASEPYIAGPAVDTQCCITVVSPQEEPKIDCMCKIEIEITPCCRTPVIQPPGSQRECVCPLDPGIYGGANINIPVGGSLGLLGPGIFVPPGYDRCKDGPLMFSAGGCGEPTLLMAKGPREIEKGIQSLEKRIAEHEAKLALYIENPDAHDHLGVLNGLPEEIRQKIVEGRIKKLEKEIQKFEREIEKLKQQLDDNT
jgi:RHS repeat-associated protein